MILHPYSCLSLSWPRPSCRGFNWCWPSGPAAPGPRVRAEWGCSTVRARGVTSSARAPAPWAGTETGFSWSPRAGSGSSARTAMRKDRGVGGSHISFSSEHQATIQPIDVEILGSSHLSTPDTLDEAIDSSRAAEDVGVVRIPYTPPGRTDKKMRCETLRPPNTGNTRTSLRPGACTPATWEAESRLRIG